MDSHGQELDCDELGFKSVCDELGFKLVSNLQNTNIQIKTIKYQQLEESSVGSQHVCQHELQKSKM